METGVDDLLMTSLTLPPCEGCSGRLLLLRSRTLSITGLLQCVLILLLGMLVVERLLPMSVHYLLILVW
jgi:hypothetical protein